MTFPHTKHQNKLVPLEAAAHRIVPKKRGQTENEKGNLKKIIGCNLYSVMDHLYDMYNWAATTTHDLWSYFDPASL